MLIQIDNMLIDGDAIMFAQHDPFSFETRFDLRGDRKFVFLDKDQTIWNRIKTYAARPTIINESSRLVVEIPGETCTKCHRRLPVCLIHSVFDGRRTHGPFCQKCLDESGLLASTP